MAIVRRAASVLLVLGLAVAGCGPAGSASGRPAVSDAGGYDYQSPPPVRSAAGADAVDVPAPPGYVALQAMLFTAIEPG